MDTRFMTNVTPWNFEMLNLMADIDFGTSFMQAKVIVKWSWLFFHTHTFDQE